MYIEEENQNNFARTINIVIFNQIDIGHVFLSIELRGQIIQK